MLTNFDEFFYGKDSHYTNHSNLVLIWITEKHQIWNLRQRGRNSCKNSAASTALMEVSVVTSVTELDLMLLCVYSSKLTQIDSSFCSFYPVSLHSVH